MKKNQEYLKETLSSQKTLQWFLRFGVFFMLAEAVYHASGVRISGLETVWPADALLFAWFMMMLWALASLFIAAVLWVISTNIRAYSAFLVPIACVLLIHGFFLYYVSFLQVEHIFTTPALYVWNPWFSWQLRLEGFLLHVFSGLVMLHAFKYK